jgi:hypothetical protein
MNIDCTLNTFSVPGFTGVNPPFGTKRPTGESVSSREAHVNIAMPFTQMRPHIVNENSTTTELESNRVFEITEPGVMLQISDAVYNGCKALVINSSPDSATVTINETRTVTLFSGEIIEFKYSNGTWNPCTVKTTVRSLLELSLIDDEPIVASTANVNIATGGLVNIDGIALQPGSRVLLKDQIDGRQNGYWIVQSGAWNRDASYGNGDQTAFMNKLIRPQQGSQRGKLFILAQDNYTVGTSVLNFIESKFAVAPMPGKIPMFDKNGLLPGKTINADVIEGNGRDLRLVFGITSNDPLVYIPQIMAEIRRRCNNNGEIDASKIPDFSGIEIGDYVDGIDLSGIAVAPGGTAPAAWNDTYKNNRIVVSGFNTYKHSGEPENAKNHILFTFRNVLCTGRMKSTNDNSGGYKATEMRAWLDGATGDGSGTFASRLKTALGGNYLYTIRRLLSDKTTWTWENYTVFLASENEIFGAPHWSEMGYGDGLAVQFPIYQKSTVYRVKKLNGSRKWYWEASPYADDSTYYCYVNNGGGYASYGNASTTDGGVSPAFCVA